MKIDHPCFRKYKVGHPSCVQCNLKDPCIEETVVIRVSVLDDAEYTSFMEQFKDYDPDLFRREDSVHTCSNCTALWTGNPNEHVCQQPKKDKP